MKRSTFVLLVAFAFAGIAASLLLQRHGAAAIREDQNSLRLQQDEIERVTAESHLLSSGVAETEQVANARGTDYAAELGRLRAEAAALRAQEVQLSNQQWSIRLSAGVSLLSVGNRNLTEHNRTIESTMAGGPRPGSGKLNDARSFAAALRKYAREHEGQFPSTLDQVTAYLPQPLTNNAPGWLNAPVSGTNDFEIVYQGSTNELGNIPARRVALLRERQPWLTPDGKWARAYGFVDGAAEIDVSDDNFQSWDEVHVVPPAANP